jgi:hypothetical protein
VMLSPGIPVASLLPAALDSAVSVAVLAHPVSNIAAAAIPANAFTALLFCLM